MSDQFQLRLTPASDAAIERDRLERETRYRRDYWQRYKDTHKRVFGTLTKAQHAQIKAVADANDRPVWTQIWAESCAYRNAEFLPSTEIMARQDRLIAELRRIGNNLNQLAARGHVQNLPDGTRALASQMLALEQQIQDFTRQPWVKSGQ